ncbi:MAG: hypothetical protein ACJAW1_003751, partial [Glaciecola sp.]
PRVKPTLSDGNAIKQHRMLFFRKIRRLAALKSVQQHDTFASPFYTAFFKGGFFTFDTPTKN